MTDNLEVHEYKLTILEVALKIEKRTINKCMTLSKINLIII